MMPEIKFGALVSKACAQTFVVSHRPLNIFFGLVLWAMPGDAQGFLLALLSGITLMVLGDHMGRQ